MIPKFSSMRKAYPLRPGIDPRPRKMCSWGEVYWQFIVYIGRSTPADVKKNQMDITNPTITRFVAEFMVLDNTTEVTLEESDHNAQSTVSIPLPFRRINSTPTFLQPGDHWLSEVSGLMTLRLTSTKLTCTSISDNPNQHQHHESKSISTLT